MGGSTLIWNHIDLWFIMLVNWCIDHPFRMLDNRRVPAMVIGASLVPFVRYSPDSTDARRVWSIAWMSVDTGNDDRFLSPLCFVATLIPQLQEDFDPDQSLECHLGTGDYDRGITRPFRLRWPGTSQSLIDCLSADGMYQSNVSAGFNKCLSLLLPGYSSI